MWPSLERDLIYTSKLVISYTVSNKQEVCLGGSLNHLRSKVTSNLFSAVARGSSNQEER